MRAKALEVRDSLTFIAVLAVDMNPQSSWSEDDGAWSEDGWAWSEDDGAAQRWLLRRCGYPCDSNPNILITRLDGNGKATNDPCEWGDRTWQHAHWYILQNWSTLKDGDVIDVEFILGETSLPKVSERKERS